MIVNRFFVRGIIAGLISIPLFSMLALADAGINGIWSAAERTKGGLGAQWVFTGNGNVTYTFGALVDFNYVINGSTLSMTLSQPDAVTSDSAIVQNFILNDDELIIRENDREKRMQRITEQFTDKHPVVGDWSYIHKTTGRPAIMRFRDNGAAQLSVPFETRTGIYYLDDDILSISITGKKPFKRHIKFDQSRLTFTNQENTENNQYIKLSQ